MTASLHTFVFADLAGYSALTEAHGDEQAADTAADFFEIVRSLLPEHDAEEVKVIGDAVLLRVVDPARAAGLAERIVCDHGTRHRALGVRVGMHTGTAVRRNDDWFGSAVNIAARIADMARAGEILCAAATREAIGPAVPFRERGERVLRNLVEPVEVYEFVLTQRAGRLPMDPVCRMAVDPTLAVGRRAHGGSDYYFCSERCLQAFDRAPETYGVMGSR
jgi:adenylate cyclase